MKTNCRICNRELTIDLKTHCTWDSCLCKSCYFKELEKPCEIKHITNVDSLCNSNIYAGSTTDFERFKIKKVNILNHMTSLLKDVHEDQKLDALAMMLKDFTDGKWKK